jgi:Tol biopolymer transport system component
VAAGLALTLAISAACAGCGSASAPPGSAAARPAAAANQTASAGLDGHGELAFIAHGGLFLTGGPAGKLRRVSLPGVPAAPAWSTSHRWLAVQVAKPAPAGSPGLQGPAALWVVDAAGTSTTKVTPPSWDVTSFAWSPRSSRLAVAAATPAQAGTTGVAAVVTTAGARKVLATGTYVSGVAWSPDGRQIAAGLYTGRPIWGGKVVLLSTSGGPPTLVTFSKGNVLDLAGWWPSGSGLLYWTDTGGSASLAADGLPLATVSIRGREVRQLTATMLEHTSWLAFSPTGNLGRGGGARASTVAVTSGGDRVIWAGHKRIIVCRRSGGCSPVGQAPGVVSLDPSWSPGGTRLVFARASATGPFGPAGHAGFSPSWIRRWQATSRLWVSSAGGSAVRPLTAAGQGALDPVWGTDGSLLFVRNDAIWLLPTGTASPLRVTGPLGAITGGAYYGYVPYPGLIAWTLA